MQVKPKRVALGTRFLRINHAGEHGAVNIYRAQRLMLRWFDSEFAQSLFEFQQHEEAHRNQFEIALRKKVNRAFRNHSMLWKAYGYWLSSGF